MIAQDPVPSLDDQVGGLAARTARRWYKPTVGALLERHHWNLALRREALTLVTNNRGSGFAYARPADCAYLVNVGGMQGGIGYYAGIRDILSRGPRFERVGNIIYTNTPGAVADFTSFQTTEAAFSEELCDVIVLTLAARFAMPITKKMTTAEKYRQMAADALTMAMARNLNENAPRYGDTPTETEIARGGIGYTGSGFVTNDVPGTVFDPVAQPIGAPIVPDVGPAGDYLYEG
ncbi:MAG TPA: hypothetical protein VF638_14295 [Sphingomonas sp.]|jgi:hypothetical protein